MQALLSCLHEDEATVLTTILQQAGLSVRLVKNFSRAIENWPQHPSDLILAAISSEETRAVKQVQQIRMEAAVPFIVISDPLSENEQVNLIESGVDLVISRPYGVRLLLAQIKSLLRRNAGLPFYTLPTLTQAGVTLDPSNRTVQVEKSNPKRLTQLEFRLLYSFITNPGRIISPENLVEQVWGYSGEGNRDLVRGLVQRLRSKVEPNPGQPRFILTEPGLGYYFNKDA